MTCARVRGRLSEWLDGELEPEAARAVSSHLRQCAECARRADELRSVSALLTGLPRLESREPVAARVLDRLEMEAEPPARPAVLFRGLAAARPCCRASCPPGSCS
jgi:anti-sigma factor RsiW